MKHLLAITILPPLNTEHLEARLETTLAYYAALRPHQGLNGATPWEIFYGKDPAANSAIPPPRKGTRQPPDVTELPLTVTHLDAQHRLPVLIPKNPAA